MAEDDESLEYRPANIQINTQICAGDIGGITHKCGRSFEHTGADEGPDDNAEADIANQVCRGGAAKHGARDDRYPQCHHQDVYGFPKGADLGTAILTDDVEPSPVQTFAQILRVRNGRPGWLVAPAVKSKAVDATPFVM